ncbi:MAG: glycosyltransferase [Verrucomicrobiota bacterium]
MLPALSICIPAYKADRFLGETLASVYRQTFADWELLIVEDGSRDGTEDIVRQFAKTVTQSVRFIRHEVNKGLPATRNTAIEVAQAEWIVLLDSDDLWETTHLAELVATARANPKADLVHSGSVLFDSDTGRETEHRYPSPEVLKEFPRSLYEGRYIIQPASVMLKRSLWERAGRFDPAFRYVEDRDMWLRCARAGGIFAFTGRNTCRYRKHANALSTHSAAMAEADAAVFDKHLDWEAIPSELRRQRAAHGWAAAGKLRQRGAPAVAQRHFRRACETDWRLEWWLRGQACRMLSLLKPR